MSSEDDLQRSIEDIVLSIKAGIVIPIIGYDLLFNEFDNRNDEKDFLKVLIQKHAEKGNPTLRDEIFKNGGKQTGYELINTYYHSLELKEQQLFKLKFSQTIKENRIDANLIPESFRKLVSIKKFKLFVNGTFTNLLELALNTYRADGKTPDEIKKSYEVLSYHPIDPKDLPTSVPSPRFIVNFEKPIIYNLFGTHDEDGGDYLLTDADYIELIYDLMSNKTLKCNNLLSYLGEANVLFLGCNFPDWFFRFFIRVCVGDRLDSVTALQRKTVIDSLSLNTLDSSRTLFISNYKIQTLKIDCIKLVDEIYKEFSKSDNLSGIILGRGNNNVFISYCRSDERVAKDVAKQLDQKYIEYYIDDERLAAGEELDKNIANAIDRCSIFLPIVSTNVKNSSKYVWKEWQYAIAQQKEIWPIFKDFVDKEMLLPEEFGADPNLRRQILDPGNKIGIRLSGKTDDKNLAEIAARENVISEKELIKLKDAQFRSRISRK